MHIADQAILLTRALLVERGLVTVIYGDIEICRDSATLLVCQARMPVGLDLAMRERQIRCLADVVLLPDQVKDQQREVLLICTARGRICGTATDVVVALDALANREAMIKELLSDARIRRYDGSEKDAYKCWRERHMWQASITAVEGQTIPVFDFVKLMGL